MAGMDESLVAWLDEEADNLDADTLHADALPARLAQAGLFAVGVPEGEGGDGRALSAAVDVVAGLAEHSLSAAFVYWAQRAVIACLLASPNRDLVRRLVPDLLRGRLAGAPGLSNAMKFLGGLERLRITGVAAPDGMRLNGTVAWATNLRRHGFVAAIAVGDEHGDNPSVFALPHDAPGVARESDLDLLALRGTNTAALRLSDVALDASWQIHPQARVFLPGIRPAFIGLQCGLGLGLARASLRSARVALAGRPSVLSGDIDALDADIAAYSQTLCTGLDDGTLRDRPRALLTLRLRMVDIAAAAVALELQALGDAPCCAQRTAVTPAARAKRRSSQSSRRPLRS
ncbi:acyl-CoA/acyl-ACP dehydrogenase [Telluria mixta]|uniref:acyl-CoA dehydrogenase family protein n=1 Tax=Telluria mixta TaxID=34071 RepID=UPI002478AF90|nr:acyl-CoA dehydrogenase family protein [Telluria mixta]WEM94245.1 acyl-CoA/acyl-ACP dehydrogenase [Telluria mixta]